LFQVADATLFKGPDMEVKVRAALAALSLVLLSACGGSSGDSDFEGVWRGAYIPEVQPPFRSSPSHAMAAPHSSTIEMASPS
jgi:hypothetical protein